MINEEVKGSIKTQFLFRFLFMGVFIVAVFVALMVISFQKNTEENGLNQVKSIEGIYKSFIENDQRMLSAALENFEIHDSFKEALVQKNREKLKEMSMNIYLKNRDQFDITHFYYITEDGKCFLRMHQPDFFDDIITRTTFQMAKSSNKRAQGVELGKTAYALRVIKPYIYEGKKIGYIEFGEEIHHFDHIIQKQMGTNVIVMGEKKYLDKEKYRQLREKAGKINDWDALKNYVVLSDTFEKGDYFLKNIFKEEEVTAVREAKYLGTHEYEGRTYIKGVFPFYEAGNKQTGIVYLLTDMTEHVAHFKSSLIYSVIIGLVLFLFFLGLALRYLTVKIFRPIISLAGKADQISLGEELEEEIKSDRQDEIGLLIRSFDRMRISLNKLMQRLTDKRR